VVFASSFLLGSMFDEEMRNFVSIAFWCLCLGLCFFRVSYYMVYVGVCGSILFGCPLIDDRDNLLEMHCVCMCVFGISYITIHMGFEMKWSESSSTLLCDMIDEKLANVFFVFHVFCTCWWFDISSQNVFVCV
jgi:hypothetical protein